MSKPTTPPPSLKPQHPAPSPSTHSPLPKRAKQASPQPTPAPTMSTTKERTSIAVPDLSTSPPLLLKLLTSTAQPPKRGSQFAAGYDIFASEATTIPARGKGLVSTGISMAVPAGTYGRIAPRSGLAAKHHIDTGAGVIDADYRGEVKVLLFNHGEGEFVVNVGDRVAQLIVERIYTPEIEVVEELEESVRGAGGFGSTGVGIGDGKGENLSGHESHGAGGAGGIA